MSELKDCPFCGPCGCPPEYQLDTQYQDRHVIECGNCGIQKRYEYSKEGVIQEWNTRPLDDKAKKNNSAIDMASAISKSSKLFADALLEELSK